MSKKTGSKAVSPLNGVPLPNPGPGRPKGSKNKISSTAKENVANVFELLGGVKGMFRWAAKSDRNKAIFYQSIYSKIISQEHEHSGEVNTGGHLVVEVVHIKGAEIPGDDGGNGQKGK